MAKKKECPSCALEVDRHAKQCHYCGYEFPETSAGKKFAAIILILLLLIWLVFGLLLR
jgi:hypothetical protein